MRYFYIFVFISIVYGIYLFSYHLLHGDLLFHTDIARDFLLIQDIAVNHKLTLIGPRAGGIPGTFFGPLWLYLMIPAFLIGHGNPITVGYFWLVLALIGLGITYYVVNKIFNPIIAICATALFTYSIIFLAPGFTQSFAPVVLSPLFLYIVYLFVEKKQIRYLGWSAFLSGILIQFQPAYGSIMLAITFLISLFLLVKRKQKRFLLLWFISLLPLSTYILFELRHNFLETHALYNFIFHHNTQSYQQVNFAYLVQNRMEGFFGTVNIINNNTLFYNLFFVFLNLCIVILWIKTKKSGQRTFILLIYLYIIGFWLLTFLFQGTVWNYYYLGFIPLVAIALSSLITYLPKFLFFCLFSLLLVIMIANGYRSVTLWQSHFSGKDTSSWLLNKQVAKYIFQNTHQNFGYYVYSPDEFGYSKKYAMSYINLTDNYAEKGYLCTKKPITYLIYEPTFSDSHTDPVFWKNVEVNIKTKPVSIKMFHQVRVEKYLLTSRQIKQPSDPTMICGLQWR